MNDGEIYEILTGLFREILDDTNALTPATTPDDVEGWDSFAHLNIIVAVEERFRIKFTTREIETLANVGALAELIRRKAGIGAGA